MGRRERRCRRLLQAPRFQDEAGGLQGTRRQIRALVHCKATQRNPIQRTIPIEAGADRAGLCSAPIQPRTTEPTGTSDHRRLREGGREKPLEPDRTKPPVRPETKPPPGFSETCGVAPGARGTESGLPSFRPRRWHWPSRGMRCSRRSENAVPRTKHRTTNTGHDGPLARRKKTARSIRVDNNISSQLVVLVILNSLNENSVGNESIWCSEEVLLAISPL